jgi:hypothetical protein
MIELDIDREHLRAFSKALWTNAPIDPGPGGWTISKALALAAVCQEMLVGVSGRDRRPFNEIEATVVAGRELMEHWERNAMADRVDPAAAVALCRNLFRMLAYGGGLWDEAFTGPRVRVVVGWVTDEDRVGAKWVDGNRSGQDEWRLDAFGRRDADFRAK